jgi:hypothetical protein
MAAMCEKCVELDGKIERYRRLASSVSDQLTSHRIGLLIEELTAEKAKLHRDEE